MTKVQLQATLQSGTKDTARIIRSAGYIPAIVYGSGVTNRKVKIKNHDFEKAFKLAGNFNLVDLSVGEEKAVKVIVKEVQRDTLTNGIIHVDFYQVNMTKKIIAEIPLSFIGESKAVKDLGGTLVKNMNTVKVSCLPGDLVNYIEVDLSKLLSFNQFIRLHDLVLPPGVELPGATNEAVVGVVETKIEAEAPKPAEAAPAEGATPDVEAASKETKDNQGKEVKSEEKKAEVKK